MPLDLTLTGLRGLHLAALAIAAGALLLPRLADIAPPRIARAALLAALITGLAWLALQGAISSPAGFPEAQWLMLSATGFGRVMALRLALLLAALALPARALWFLLPAIALQPLLGHGAASGAGVALGGALHSLAALLWIGALPGLFWLALTRPETALTAARRFSPLGVLLVLSLGAGIWGLWPLAGGIPGLFGSPFGLILLAKSALFLLMLALAGLNGIWLAPDGHLRALRLSLGLELAAGLTALGLAALLAQQVPGLHARIDWPFPLKPAPGLWGDDFLRARLLRMLLPLAGAALLTLAALIALRRSKLLALGGFAGAGLLLWLMPIFPAAPFLRPAAPSTFLVSDSRRTPVSLLEGQRSYLAQCAGCHGDTGRGGPEATGDPVWPPVLVAPWFLGTLDGDWFHSIRHGRRTPEGRDSMPGFPDLAPREIWALIDYLRGLASAESLDRNGRWGIPPVAPAFRLRCGAAPLDPSRPPLGQPLLIGENLPAELPPGLTPLDLAHCAPLEPAIPAALATLGAEGIFLIDGSGHLRQRWSQPPDLPALAEALRHARDVPAESRARHH